MSPSLGQMGNQTRPPEMVQQLIPQGDQLDNGSNNSFPVETVTTYQMAGKPGYLSRLPVCVEST